MSFHNEKRLAAEEIKAEENWRKAREGWKRFKLMGKIAGLALLLTFTYYSGERNGFAICSPYRELGL